MKKGSTLSNNTNSLARKNKRFYRSKKTKRKKKINRKSFKINMLKIWMIMPYLIYQIKWIRFLRSKYKKA
jgi:hypothetical protein